MTRVTVDLAFLLLAFALVYYHFGIMDTTRPGSPIIAGTGGRPSFSTETTEAPPTPDSAERSGEQYGATMELALCVYYSTVTFTTLGYGDFQPIGWGRAIAGLEALVGYLVLGIIASSAASVLQSSAERERDERS